MAHYTVMNMSNMVGVNSEFRPVDCSSLPAYFHALQWYGDSSPPYGEIEYGTDAQGKKMPNTRFSDFAPYQYLIDAWEAYVPPETRMTPKPAA
jgi:hypothetical protein